MPENSSLDKSEGWRLPERFPQIHDQNSADERGEPAWNRHAHDWRCDDMTQERHMQGQERHAQTPVKHAKDETRSVKWEDRAFEGIIDQKSLEREPVEEIDESDENEMHRSINHGEKIPSEGQGTPTFHESNKAPSGGGSSLNEASKGASDCQFFGKKFRAEIDAEIKKMMNRQDAEHDLKVLENSSQWGRGYRGSGGGGRGLSEVFSHAHFKQTDTGGVRESAVSRHRTRKALFGY